MTSTTLMYYTGYLLPYSIVIYIVCTCMMFYAVHLIYVMYTHVASQQFQPVPWRN